ncbi:MAG: DUF1844 domain-containing protein [Candidatus Omnitrophica bacterium]|nr:DUF1844 domain-containing protein [Candidatus Omnitrophota bacterium]MBI3083384.1 DUF1844 domain-containing protein [Candidatus Omnitrophota bacterium]
MDETIKKRVDESWKEQADREKHVAGQPSGPSVQPGGPAAETGVRPEAAGPPEARFDLFVSGLAMEAFIALGDMPHPTTRKQATNLPQAKYLIDLLGVLENKTKGNLSVDEERLLKDALYQLRMRYLAKSGQ